MIIFNSLFFLTIYLSSFPAGALEYGSRLMNESQNSVKTQTPVIGVLTQVLRDYKRFTDKKHLHLVASYVKWIESSGGDNLLDPHKDTPMMKAARKLYKLAVEANDKGDYYPIWGTCLGLELLTVLTSNKNMLIDCLANDISLPLNFTARGKLFAPSDLAGLNIKRDYPRIIMETLESKNLTYNFHHKCVTDESLEKAELDDFYQPLAYSTDVNGIRFIAILEAKRYPFFSVQFHPEKATYEFVVKKDQFNIDHTTEAIATSRYFADFFITSAQMNSHRAEETFKRYLIYNYNPVCLVSKNDIYEQRYLFAYEDNGLTTEEFLDHVPEDGEEAPEDVDTILNGKRKLSPAEAKILTKQLMNVNV